MGAVQGTMVITSLEVSLEITDNNKIQLNSTFGKDITTEHKIKSSLGRNKQSSHRYKVGMLHYQNKDPCVEHTLKVVYCCLLCFVLFVCFSLLTLFVKLLVHF